ncbi:MAG: alpha/beta fold hydrolase [Actinomycetes bacterium]
MNTMTKETTGRPTTQYLGRGSDQIAYDVQGDGRLVVAVPGMGDLRGTYRFLVPALVAAGFRVATVDLRGHGQSGVDFDRFDDVAAASDVVALIEHLGGPANIIGNSMGAGVAVIAAADRPDLVDRLVLTGPFVRDVPTPPGMSIAMRVALLRPWGPRVWRTFHRKMFATRVPGDYAAYRDDLMATLTRPGAWKALQQTTRTSHRPAEERLDRVRAKTLVVMGGSDPDFKDPAAEAELVADRLGGRVVLVPDAGHYPQAEFPEVVGPVVAEFLKA